MKVILPCRENVNLPLEVLLIEPETEFEEQWLRNKEIVNSFHKCGQSPADYVGLKLVLMKKPTA